ARTAWMRSGEQRKCECRRGSATSSSSDRQIEGDGGAGAGRRDDGERTAEGGGAAAQARQTMAIGWRDRIETLTVVAELEPQDAALDREPHERLAASRVLHDVDDAFLEDQEHFPADVRAHLDFLIG